MRKSVKFIGGLTIIAIFVTIFILIWEPTWQIARVLLTEFFALLFINAIDTALEEGI